jgi:lipopolysaccharide assembly outer membrane protein LptD (OstA)
MSNRQDYDAQLERFVSTGNVTAKIAGGRLQADRIEFDPASRTLFAVGAVRFQRGQQFFQASRLRYSLLEGTGRWTTSMACWIWTAAPRIWI